MDGIFYKDSTGKLQFEATLGSLRFYDITKPHEPKLVSFWGPEIHAFPNINAATATDADLQLLIDFVRGINPPSFGFDTTFLRIPNKAFFVSIDKNADRAYVGTGNYGLILLDIKDLKKIKVISQARDLVDAHRAKLLESVQNAVSSNGKVVVEQAGAASSFSSFKILQPLPKSSPASVRMIM